jgi:hypothetical protein
VFGARNRLGLSARPLQLGVPIRPRQPPLPSRLVAGLLILKHMHDLADEVLCGRWVENP